MKPIPGERENCLVSDTFLKEYFQLKQEPIDAFQHFRKSFQSQLFQHTRRGKTTKRTCTDQFYALSQQCYGANQNFENKIIVDADRGEETENKRLNRIPTLVTRQLPKGKLTPQRSNGKESPYLLTNEDAYLELCGSFRFIHGNVKLLADILTQNRYQQVHAISNLNNHYSITNQPCDLIWSCTHVNPSSLPSYQKINFFPHSYECTRKDSLARNMNTLMEIFGQRHFLFMPECFIWPQEKDQLRQTMRSRPHSTPLKPTLVSRKRQKLQKMRSESGVKPTKPIHIIPWIVKPASRSQGKGIFIVTTYEDIETHLHALKEEKESYIVEKYINNPLLINGKKFDLRIYVLVTSFHPLKIYIHRDGLVRRASEKYDPSNFSNRFSHLTNYSVNKNHSQFSHSTSPLTVGETVDEVDSGEGTKESTFKNLYEYSTMIDGIKIDFNLDDLPGAIDFMDDANPRRGSNIESETVVNGDQNEADLVKNSLSGNVSVDGTSYSTANYSYGNNDDGDKFGLKMSFADLNQWFQSNNIDSALIWGKIEDLVIKTLIVTEGKINAAMNVNPVNSDCCFELFGFDVLIDNQLNPWLMEVNFAPSLSTDSSLDYKVKGQVLLDLLNVIGLKKGIEKGKDSEGNEKSTLPSTLRVPMAIHGEAGDSSLRNPNANRFKFSGNFRGQTISFPQKDFVQKETTLEEKEVNDPIHEKVKTEERIIAEAIVQYFHQNDLTSPQDRRILRQFLQEKDRCMNSRFQLIFPTKSTFPIYAKFFIEQRKFNQVIGRYEFFLMEYMKLLKQRENKGRVLTVDPSDGHFLQKSRSVGANKNDIAALLQTPVNPQVAALPRSSSSSNIRAKTGNSFSCVLNEEILVQVHARWAKAMGISTLRNSNKSFS